MSRPRGTILFLTPYPRGAAPSQRFRFEQYLSFLEEAGFRIVYKSFWSPHAWSILYAPRNRRYKVFWLFWGFLRRLGHVIRYGRADYIFIHREADPLGTPLFPWMLAWILRKRIIYDFDDAIWIPNASQSNRQLMHFKYWGNARWLCRLAFTVHAGNEFLAEYARQYNSRVKVIPTTINTEAWHNKIKVHEDNEPFVLGWTGSHSTLTYLDDLLPVLKEIQNELPVEIVVICDARPSWTDVRIDFIPWNKETEVEDLLRLNVGLMPLRDDPWSRGKCGFKALQYMALGIPALVSPVGVNSQIVDHGVNGFLCETPEDWKQAIRLLYHDRALLRKMGAAARPKIERAFSVRAVKPEFLKTFLGE
jgi:glycosyltransferase involved in cell wall biosynthesis